MSVTPRVWVTVHLGLTRGTTRSAEAAPAVTHAASATEATRIREYVMECSLFRDEKDGGGSPAAETLADMARGGLVLAERARQNAPVRLASLRFTLPFALLAVS